jgi:hypothetical protein
VILLSDDPGAIGQSRYKKGETGVLRASRNRDESGAIIATTADYAAVRELVADVFAEGIEATVPATVRETVDAVAALKKNEVSLGELAAKLALDKSVTSRRLRERPG